MRSMDLVVLTGTMNDAQHDVCAAQYHSIGCGRGLFVDEVEDAGCVQLAWPGGARVVTPQALWSVGLLGDALCRQYRYAIALPIKTL